MNTQVNNFWYRWLLLTTIGVMAFSLSFILLPDQMQAFFHALMFSTQDTAPLFGAEVIDYIKFFNGVLGAVMFGWSVSLLLILRGMFSRGEREGWNAIFLSIGIWFLVDSGWSLYSGFAVNVALNTGFLILFMIPLAATYRDFHK